MEINCMTGRVIQADIPFEASSIGLIEGRDNAEPRMEYSSYCLTVGTAIIDLLHDFLCDLQLLALLYMQYGYYGTGHWPIRSQYAS